MQDWPLDGPKDVLRSFEMSAWMTVGGNLHYTRSLQRHDLSTPEARFCLRRPLGRDVWPMVLVEKTRLHHLLLLRPLPGIGLPRLWDVHVVSVVQL